MIDFVERLGFHQQYISKSIHHKISGGGVEIRRNGFCYEELTYVITRIGIAGLILFVNAFRIPRGATCLEDGDIFALVAWLILAHELRRR